jgi:hypothetical protein
MCDADIEEILGVTYQYKVENCQHKECRPELTKLVVLYRVVVHVCWCYFVALFV